MKKFLAALLIMSAATLAVGFQAQPGEWVKVTSPEGKFSVLMPAQPTKESKTSQDPRFGNYTTNLFMAKGDREIFVAGWVDYDPKFNFDRQSELEANRDNFIKGISATLLNTTKIAYNNDDDYPGIEFTAETAQVFVRSRVYIIGRRPYQLIAVVPAGNTSSPNIAKFLSSFQLTPASR